MVDTKVVAMAVVACLVAAGIGIAVFVSNNNVSNNDDIENFDVTFSSDGFGSIDMDKITVKKGTTWTSNENVLTFSNGEKVTADSNVEWSKFSEWSLKEGTVDKNTAITAKFKLISDVSSVYLADNFENDEFTNIASYETSKNNVIPGIWLYGSGSDAEEVIKSACDFYGIEVTFNNGKIKEIGGVIDGNIHVSYWDGDSWVQSDDIGDIDEKGKKYISIIHGKSADNGKAPSVNTTPDEIKWHYGEQIQHKVTSGKMVKYYLNLDS